MIRYKSLRSDCFQLILPAELLTKANIVRTSLNDTGYIIIVKLCDLDKT